MGKMVTAIGGGFLAFIVVILMLFGGGASEDANPPADPADVGGGGGGLQSAGMIPGPYMPVIKQAGSKCKEITPAIIAAQTFAESGFKDHPANYAGAEGPSQFVPGAWSEWGKDYDHDGKADVHNFKDSIPSQADLMCDFIKKVNAALKSGKVKGDPLSLALAGYNCGWQCVLDAHGMPGNAQTRAYSPKIIALAKKFEAPGVALPGGMEGKILAAAMSQVGKKYILGTGGPGRNEWPTYDCSGLVSWAVWKEAHITLPHYTGDMRLDPHLSQVITRTRGDTSKMKPGDIIFFNIPEDPAPWGHVAFYLGDGKIVEAANPRDGLKTETIKSGYYMTVDWEVRRLKN